VAFEINLGIYKGDLNAKRFPKHKIKLDLSATARLTRASHGGILISIWEVQDPVLYQHLKVQSCFDFKIIFLISIIIHYDMRYSNEDALTPIPTYYYNLETICDSE